MEKQGAGSDGGAYLDISYGTEISGVRLLGGGCWEVAAGRRGFGGIGLTHAVLSTCTSKVDYCP